MTWKDIKRATLHHLFVIEGGTVVISDVTKPYLHAMPMAANEGIYLLASVGGAGIRVLSFEKKRGSGSYDRFDMNKYAPDFRSFAGEVYIEKGGERKRVFGFQTEARSILVLPSQLEGEVFVYYNPIPEIISSKTSDEHEIDLLPMASSLLPLYMASQLFKDDDMRQAVQLRNEFEAGLGRLSAMLTKDGKKKEAFSSVTGWR